MTGWTSQHVRHVGELFKQSRNPVARVYESIGSDCFLAIAPGWLNLGLWDGPGTEDEAERALGIEHVGGELFDPGRAELVMRCTIPAASMKS